MNPQKSLMINIHNNDENNSYNGYNLQWNETQRMS